MARSCGSSVVRRTCDSILARSSWTLRSEVSITRSASPRRSRSRVALLGDAVDDPAVALQRVRSADALEPPDQGVVGGLQEDHPQPDAAPLQVLQRGSAGRRRSCGRGRRPPLLSGRPRPASAPRGRPWSVISDGGRLSTTNQPRSSRHLAAVLRPAPDMPEMITSSGATSGASTVADGHRWYYQTQSLLLPAFARIINLDARGRLRLPCVTRTSVITIGDDFPGRRVNGRSSRCRRGQRCHDNRPPCGGPNPGTSQISSTVAARIRLTEPKCLSRALRRVSPRPGTSSRPPAVMRAWRASAGGR